MPSLLGWTRGQSKLYPDVCLQRGLTQDIHETYEVFRVESVCELSDNIDWCRAILNGSLVMKYIWHTHLINPTSLYSLPPCHSNNSHPPNIMQGLTTQIVTLPNLMCHMLYQARNYYSNLLCQSRASQSAPAMAEIPKWSEVKVSVHLSCSLLYITSWVLNIWKLTYV